MTTSSDPASQSVRDRVLDAATRLFSHLGYDTTTLQMIADSVGADLATVTGQAGNKREIYTAVMERAAEAEYASAVAASADLTLDLAGLIRLADAYLDFCLEHPEFPALIMQRWLWDAAEETDVEDRFLKPLHSIPRGAIQRIFQERTGGGQPPFDLEIAEWTIVWCVNGFVQAGFRDEQGNRRSPQDPRVIRRFRAHMHQMIGRVTRLDP